MNARRLPFAVALALLAALPVPTARAQGHADMLPTALVTALLSGATASGGAPVTYVVGELPRGWPAELVPAHFRVIGGMSEGRTLVAVMSDTSPRPLAEFTALLQRAGFKPPAPPPGRGFMSSTGSFTRYCRDSATVRTTTAPAPAGSRYVRVTYFVSNRMACAPVVVTPARPAAELEIPELGPPPGMRSGRSSGGSSSDEVTSRGTLTGRSINAAGLLAHYERLLTAAGWTASPATTSASGGAQLFTARDKTGHTWHGALTAFVTSTGGEVSLDMQPEVTP